MNKTKGNVNRTYRKTAILVGALFIMGTVAGALSVVFRDPFQSIQVAVSQA